MIFWLQRYSRAIRILKISFIKYLIKSTKMSLPELKIKTKGKLINIDGKKMNFSIEKYVTLQQSNYPEKTFVLQEILFDDGNKEIRIGYYIIGKKPRMQGKWVWGQYCPFIPKHDFEKLLDKAKEKGIL